MPRRHPRRRGLPDALAAARTQVDQDERAEARRQRREAEEARARAARPGEPPPPVEPLVCGACGTPLGAGHGRPVLVGHVGIRCEACRPPVDVTAELPLAEPPLRWLPVPELVEVEDGSRMRANPVDRGRGRRHRRRAGTPPPRSTGRRSPVEVRYVELPIVGHLDPSEHRGRPQRAAEPFWGRSAGR